MKWPENMQIQEETYPEDPVWLQFIDNNIKIVYIVVNSWCLQTQKIQKKLKWTFDGFDVRISKWDFLLRSNLRELQRTLQASSCEMDGSVGIVLKICIRRTPYLNKSKKGSGFPIVAAVPTIAHRGKNNALFGAFFTVSFIKLFQCTID